MRTLLLTLILAAPLLAQEAEEPQPDKQDKQVEQEIRKKRDKADRIRKLVETFVDGKDAKKLEELERRLREMLKDDSLWFEFQPVQAQEMRLLFSDHPQGGNEAIAGSFDGTSYSLKSLGGGKYKLTATQKVRDGESRPITDEGTLKELRKKYPFLKSMGAAVWTFDEPFELGPLVSLTDRSGPRLGMLVRPPSESLSYHLELPTGAGLVVDSVTRGSRAEKLGLKKHDVLLRIDGELIDSPEQLKKLHKNKGKLEYVRRGKPRTLDLSKLADEK